MIRFLALRLLRAMFVLMGVSVFAFVLIDLAPGHYFEEMRLNPQISRETIAAVQVEYGLDRPLPVRYWRWLRSVSRGELGFSVAYKSPVWPLLRPRIANTLILTTAALVCSWLIAIPLGVWMASHPRRWMSRVVGMGNTFLLVTPDVLISLALLALALGTGWFPTGGMHAPASDSELFGNLKDLTMHLLLPVCTLAAAMLPVLVRHVRSAMLEVLESQFIVAARGHGISQFRLLFRHALPAAANPLISLFGVSVGLLLSGSLLVEVIMSWPGLGPMLLQSILERDPHVVVAAVLLSTVFLVAGSLLADVFLCIADPRIRVE